MYDRLVEGLVEKVVSEWLSTTHHPPSINLKIIRKLMSRIEEALQKLFDKYRVITWYDEKRELEEQFRELALPEVNKIVVGNNQFHVKYLVIRERPGEKFLLYFPYRQPAPSDNWLLDIQLSGYQFQTDQESLYLQELEMDMRFRKLLGEHLEFFRSRERRTKLKEMLEKEDDERAIRYKMLAVTLGLDHPSLMSFIQHQGVGFIKGETRDKDIEKFNLKAFYWNEISARYNYQSEDPTYYGFLLEVFGANFSLCKKNGIRNETKILLSVWKDKTSLRESFRALSERIAGDLAIEDKLQQASIKDILEDDLFDLVDKKIVSVLASQIAEESVSREQVGQILKKRENKYWHGDFREFYDCLRHAHAMITMVRKVSPVRFGSFDEGIRQYSEELFAIDYHYRKFLRHFRQTGQNRVLDGLAVKVGKVYANDWLLAMNDQWQNIIDKLEKWPFSALNSQFRFYKSYVQPVISKGQRLFVIISDALRYECGWEFANRIIRENRFEAETSGMVTALPSYTQLGMAALLPGKNFSIGPGSDMVYVDDLSSSGIQGRTKILEQNSGVRATAVSAEDFMRMNSSTDGREFVKQYDLIYIFHNQIDKTGDDKTMETEVTEAVSQELHYLGELLKKIANMNGVNMVVTADHGFLYQHEILDESEFSLATFSGNTWKVNRRFVLGDHLTGDQFSRKFEASQLGISGDAEVLIPKSINRIRVKGSGSRYVHGGATLQEILVPVIRVTKRRIDTVSKVEVDIIKTNDRITTNMVAVSFIQSQLVSGTMLPRKIRATLVAEGKESISDPFVYNFDIAEGSERLREVKHYFQLSSRAREKYNNQRVTLLLEEPVDDASTWKTYKEFYYTLSLTFTSDFDNF